MTLAERLRQARTGANLTQEELATCSGVSQQMISKLESGKSKGTADIVKLAIACRVSAEWLAEKHGDPHVSSYPAMRQTQGFNLSEENPRIQLWVSLFQNLTVRQQDEFIRQITETVENNQEIAEALSQKQGIFQ